MKQFFDFIPLLVFFAVYKFYDIYTATAALMVVTVLQIAITWFTLRNLEKMHLITLAMVLVFPIAGRLADRLPPWLPIGIGLTLFALSTWLMTGVDTNTAFWTFAIWILVGRIGFGCPCYG